MKSFWERFGPADLIAIMLVLGILVRDGVSLEQSYPVVITAIIAFYFGHVSGTRQKVDIKNEVQSDKNL